MPQAGHKLEQRRWSPLPAFAFLFRNVFDVVDVGAGLGEDVLQVVADADEGETLFEKLAYARCPKQEDAENGVVLASVLDQLLRGRSEFGRGVHVRELVLVVEAHRHAKVVLSEEKDVNAGDGGDLSNVFDAGSGLDLQRDDAFVVPVAGVAEEAGLVHAALWKVNGTRTDGRGLGANDGLAGLFGGVDVGDEDAVGSEIEGLLDAGAIVVSSN